MSKRQSPSKLLRLILLALLGTISLCFLLLDFPLPILPGYLKVDFSEIPALMAALIFSPIAGVIVEAIKNLLYLVVGGGEPVGVTANFIAGIIFIVPAAILYHKYKGVKSIVSGLVVGTILSAITMTVLNYFVILPIYAWFMGMEEMKIQSIKLYTALYFIFPFNLIKGCIVGLLFIPLYLKLKTWLESKRTNAA